MDGERVMKKAVNNYTRFINYLEHHPANRRGYNVRKFFRIFVILFLLYTTYWFFMIHTTTLTFSVDSDSECVIPDMDPYDPSIMEYIFTPDPLDCNKSQDLVYINEIGEIVVNQNVLKKIGDVSCVYQIIIRVDDDTVRLDKEVKYNIGDTVNTDFFLMKCVDTNDKEVFNRYLKHVYMDKNKEKIQEQGNSEINDNREKYNVILFHIDSVSRLNGIRKLKNTYKFITETMGGYDMASYTKIADNTYPNLVPLLTGKQLVDLHDRLDYVDDFPFIWKGFQKAGYATMFAEDAPRLGVMNYQTGGFKYQPTDHYLRPYMLQVCRRSDGIWLALENKRFHMGESIMCYGNTPKYKLIMDYSAEFQIKYKNRPRFDLTILTDISHEHLNLVELCDNDLVDYLTKLKKHGIFNNSFVFVFGDHGQRFDAIRSTPIGRMEETLPMMIFSVPELLKQHHPDVDSVLRVNSKRLTTPHDVYETMLDILHGTFDEKSRYARQKSTKQLGYSFLQRIPKSRSCRSALIPDKYCACVKLEHVSIQSPEITQMAEYIVSTINKIILKHPKCAVLQLKTIKSASMVTDSTTPTESTFLSQFWRSNSKSSVKKYMVSIETRPSGALFEADVKYDHSNKMADITDDISRINKYGNQSLCVESTILKLYCFCQ